MIYNLTQIQIQVVKYKYKWVKEKGVINEMHSLYYSIERKNR
jgi:hypothetical protein